MPGARRDTAPPLRGRATPEGTRLYLERFAAHREHGQTLLGGTGLRVSRLGFGGYRVDDETDEHRNALNAALAAGVGLIDTSTNYTDGGSERLVGSVLRDAHEGAGPPRDAIVVVSKIGYVQGENLRLAAERERSGTPFPEMVRYMDGCWHCIHPDFLRDQLRRSLDRLGLETLDVCLLHNPEYFFSEAKKHRDRPDLARLRAEFDRRVSDAFRFFEEAVAEGTLGCYGVSSNTLVAAADDPEATSIDRFLAAAREAGGPAHHFRVVQMPMNLFESGAALLLNTGPDRSRTPLEAARDAGLAVLINRPLNAIVGNGLVRLATAPGRAPAVSLEERRRAIAALETEYRGPLAAAAGTPAEVIDPFFDLLDELGMLPERGDDLGNWKQIEQQYVVPRLNHTARALARSVNEAARDRWQDWWTRSIPAIEGLLEAVGWEASRRARSEARAVSDAIDPLLPPERRGETLSRKALWIAAGTPGVTSVLVGMRRTAWVEDAVAVLSWPPPGDPAAVYRGVKQVRLR